MFVVWHGRGWVPLAILIAGGALVELAAERGAGIAYQGWPLTAVLVATGAISWVLGRAWNGRGRADHTLFWIPLQGWGPLLVALALVNVIARS